MFMIIMDSTFWTAPYHSLTTRELKRYVLFVPPCISKKLKTVNHIHSKMVSPLSTSPIYLKIKNVYTHAALSNSNPQVEMFINF